MQQSILKTYSDDELIVERHRLQKELESVEVEISSRGTVKTDHQRAKSLLYFISQRCGGVDITTASRNADHVRIRKSYIYHCRHNNIPYNTIAKLLNRNHTSLIHSQHNFERDLKHDEKFYEIHKNLTFALREAGLLF